MKKTVYIAKCVLAKMFEIDMEHFETHTSRKRNVVEARRFLVYFLTHELQVKYDHVCNYIPSLTNHATAMHHYSKHCFMLGRYTLTRKLYKEFRTKMIKEGAEFLAESIQDKSKQIQQLQTEIINLNTITNETN
jgi:hypothetical protein